MSRYPLLRLRDVADVVAGDPAPQDPRAFGPDGPLFIRMQDVGRHHLHPALSESTDRLNPNWLRNNRLRLFPKGSVLIPKSGASVNLNHRAKLGTDAYVVSHLAVLTPNTVVIDPGYLYWWSVRFDPRSQAQVTSLPSLKLATLKEAEVPLPPLHEQRRIVAILNRAARIEALRSRAAERLREFVPALFIRMFGDPVENPMRWPPRRIGDVCNVQGGLQVSKKRNVHPIEAPYLRVANVLRDRLILDDIKLIRLTAGELARTRLQQGDLLVVEGHGNADEIGRVAVWDGSIQTCVHQNHLIRARPDRSLLMPRFAVAYLNSSSGRQQLLRRGKTTSGLNTITTSDVKDCTILVPPVGLQAKFSKIVNRAQSLVACADSGHRRVSGLSACLMADCFGHEIAPCGPFPY